jgi:hypothetical protein
MFNNVFFNTSFELIKLPVIAGLFSLFVNKQNSSEPYPFSIEGPYYFED